MIAPAQADDAVWIVVPAYNEAQHLPGTLARLRSRFRHVVVVDDGSVDRTSAVALAEDGTWLLRHVVNLGQGAALQTGIDFAIVQGAKYLVTFDADGQHDVDDIGRLLEPLRREEADVALGSRFLGKTDGMPLARWMLLKLAVLFTRAFSRVCVTDTHNGLRAFSRHAAQRIRMRLNGMAHASEILEEVRRWGLRYCEVPVTIRYSPATLEKGQSPWNSLRIVASLALARILR